MSWAGSSLGSRLLLVFLGLFLLALVLLVAMMSGSIEQAQRQEQLSQLQVQALTAARQLTDYLEEDDDEGASAGLSEWVRAFQADTGLEVGVLGRRGELLAGAPGISLEPGEWRLADGRYYVAAPVQDGHHLLGTVRLGLPVERAQNVSRKLIATLLLSCGVALVAAWLAALWLVRRLVGPLKQLEQAALAAAGGRLDTAIEVRGQDELASLARAFRTMLEQIGRSMERQRRFIADASHELRTPLTSLKLRSEALLTGGLEDPAVGRRYLEEIDAEVDRLGRLADHLLDLSRLDRPRDPVPPLDPLPTLRGLGERARPRAEQGGQTLTLSLPDSLPALRIAPEELDPMVGNLLDNALKFTPAGGVVTLRAAHEGPFVAIEVTDSGPGIASEDLPHVFESFYRADRSRRRGARAGTGLGLAIVRQLAQSVGGRVEAFSESGRGSRFRLELPAS